MNGYRFMTLFILYKSFEVLWQKQNQYSSVRIVGLSHLSGWDVVHNAGEWNTLVEEIIKEN